MAEASCNSCHMPFHNWSAKVWQKKLIAKATTVIPQVWIHLAAFVQKHVTWHHCNQLTCPICKALVCAERQDKTQSVVKLLHSLSIFVQVDQVLKQMWCLQEFLISPTQLGIPYSRPRYFAVMKHSADNATAQFAVQVGHCIVHALHVC